MLDFHKPTLSDAEWIVPFVEKSGQIGCDLSFATTYLWRNKYDIRVCLCDDTYYKAYYNDGKLAGYTYPLGGKDPKTKVDVILRDAKERGVKNPVIGMLDATNAEILHRVYNGSVKITEERDSADYVYERQNLSLLSGKKYHSKRNHISKFLRTYPDYRYEPLCSNLLNDAYSVALKWHAQSGESDTSELDAIKEALDNFDALKLTGGVLYVDNKAVAMTIASRINSKVCDVNFEKAVDIGEAYAVINNEFAKSCPEYIYLNREEDLGIEGLRKSKLSYHPDILLMKHTAVFK